MEGEERSYRLRPDVVKKKLGHLGRAVTNKLNQLLRVLVGEE